MKNNIKKPQAVARCARSRSDSRNDSFLVRRVFFILLFAILILFGPLVCYGQNLNPAIHHGTFTWSGWTVPVTGPTANTGQIGTFSSELQSGLLAQSRSFVVDSYGDGTMWYWVQTRNNETEQWYTVIRFALYQVPDSWLIPDPEPTPTPTPTPAPTPTPTPAPTAAGDSVAFNVDGTPTGLLPSYIQAKLNLTFTNGDKLQFDVPSDGNMDFTLDGKYQDMDFTSELQYFDNRIEWPQTISPKPIYSSPVQSSKIPPWDGSYNTPQQVPITFPPSGLDFGPAYSGNNNSVAGGSSSAGSNPPIVPAVTPGPHPSSSPSTITQGTRSGAYNPSQNWESTNLTAGDMRSSVGEGVKDALGDAPNLVAGAVGDWGNADELMTSGNGLQSDREQIRVVMAGLSMKWQSVINTFLLDGQLTAPSRVSVIHVPITRAPFDINLDMPIVGIFRSLFAVGIIIGAMWMAAGMIEGVFR